MNENKLLMPSEMLELSELGKANFKESVLKGPVLKNIISNVESAAADGYTGFRKSIRSEEEVRELKVIQDFFREKGYYCEFEIETKKSLLGEYKDTSLVIQWDQQK